MPPAQSALDDYHVDAETDCGNGEFGRGLSRVPSFGDHLVGDHSVRRDDLADAECTNRS
jgi:hypothetical protein